MIKYRGYAHLDKEQSNRIGGDEIFNRLWKQKRDWLGYTIGVAALHIIGISLLLSAVGTHPSLWGIGLLSYTLGMRHAFDADHIAAIDNTVRKLVQHNQRPHGVGFYFSLGHSSVVFLMSVAMALSVHWAMANLPQFESIGGVIGASVSGTFLFVIGIMNLVILVQIFKLFVQYRQGQHTQDKFEELLETRGFFARLLRPLFRFIQKSWHIYPLGFLFGLGFDTASEVALLSVSAGAAKDAVPVAGILSLPILFAAGMCLFDTADGMFMVKAYRWAFATPLRKLYYNLTVTALAVTAALTIGITELAQVVSENFGFSGSFWTWVQRLDFGVLGFALAGTFAVAWAISFGVWKLLRLEQRPSSKTMDT